MKNLSSLLLTALLLSASVQAQVGSQSHISSMSRAGGQPIVSETAPMPPFGDYQPRSNDCAEEARRQQEAFDDQPWGNQEYRSVRAAGGGGGGGASVHIHQGSATFPTVNAPAPAYVDPPTTTAPLKSYTSKRDSFRANDPPALYGRRKRSRLQYQD